MRYAFVTGSFAISFALSANGQPVDRNTSFERSTTTLAVRWVERDAAFQARTRVPELIEALGGRVREVIECVPGLAIVDFPNRNAEAAELILSLLDEYEFAEREVFLPRSSTSTIPNDTEYYQQWGHKRICLQRAWDVRTAVFPTLLIGVIDSGINYLLPDMQPNIWYNTAELGHDEDGSGFVGDYWGVSFINVPFSQDACRNEPTDPMDHCGHGTAMASIIGAVGNNSAKMCGAAWTCKMIAVQAEGQTGTDLTRVSAINYAYKRGARIMNCSFALGVSTQAFQSTFQNLTNVLFVASAGNDGVNLELPPPQRGCQTAPNYRRYPAEYTYPNILVVGASDPDEKRWGYWLPDCTISSASNYGSTVVDIFAPGVGIGFMQLDGSFSTLDEGTSCATALTTGVAALVWSQNPTWTPSQVRQRLIDTVDVQGNLAGLCVSNGRLNAAAAMGVTPCE